MGTCRMSAHARAWSVEMSDSGAQQASGALLQMWSQAGTVRQHELDGKVDAPGLKAAS
jgi:hypothetical protein